MVAQNNQVFARTAPRWAIRASRFFQASAGLVPQARLLLNMAIIHSSTRCRVISTPTAETITFVDLAGTQAQVYGLNLFKPNFEIYLPLHMGGKAFQQAFRGRADFYKRAPPAE